MNQETPDEFPFDECVPWKPENDSEDDPVQELFDYVDLLQDFPTEPDSGDEIISPVDHPFGFTGRERDADEELQCNRARHYDATLGRWINDDCD